MTKDDCFELGKITKTHGVKGEVILWIDVDFPEEYEEMDSVFLDVNGELVPFFMDSFQLRGNKAIVKFEDIETYEQAEPLVNLQAYLPLDVLPELDGDQFYYHEIVGFQVIDEKLGQLGKVRTVYTMQVQDLLVMDYQGKEVLIPIEDSIVLEADKEAQTIAVNLPDGLLEVYLND